MPRIPESRRISAEEAKQRNMELYGSKIRSLRGRKSMTVEDLAGALQVSAGSVRNWECGLARPDLELLTRMFRILDVSPNDFFGVQGAGASLSAEEKSLLEGYRLLDEIHREDVRDFVDTLNRKARLRLLRRKYGQMRLVDFRGRAAAAGDGAEWAGSAENEPVVLYGNGAVAQADEIFLVSGDSMEPQFSDGDRVLVQYCADIRIGDIGIFYAPGFGGLIKQKAYDRLHSLNPDFDDILPYEDGARVIGKVLGKVTPEMIPGRKDVDLYYEALELLGK